MLVPFCQCKRDIFHYLFSTATLTSNSTTLVPIHTTKPTVPKNTGSDVVGTFPNPVATNMKILIIIGFVLIGFLTVLAIGGSLTLVNKCCMKKKKWKIRSSSEWNYLSTFFRLWATILKGKKKQVIFFSSNNAWKTGKWNGDFLKQEPKRYTIG